MTTKTSSTEHWAFCDAILPDVSRSFALIIPQCPAPIDRALCVAYLLCRIADTVEDDANLELPQREILYDTLLEALDATDRVGAFLSAWPHAPEEECDRLVRGLRHVLTAYRSLPETMRVPIRQCVRDMVAGMRSVKAVDERNGVTFMCRDLPELDRYCHHVAGTVGIMSTALFETRLGEARFTPSPAWRENGRRLGLGLQMTNIIKDCRVDARRGVSFIPASFATFTDDGYDLARDRRSELFGHAVSHLDAAFAYIEAVPADETGIRTFLLGSFLPAIATLEVAAGGTQFHPKISRTKMNEIFACISGDLADNAALRRWYRHHRERTLTLSG